MTTTAPLPPRRIQPMLLRDYIPPVAPTINNKTGIQKHMDLALKKIQEAIPEKIRDRKMKETEKLLQKLEENRKLALAKELDINKRLVQPVIKKERTQRPLTKKDLPMKAVVQNTKTKKIKLCVLVWDDRKNALRCRKTVYPKFDNGLYSSKTGRKQMVILFKAPSVPSTDKLPTDQPPHHKYMKCLVNPLTKRIIVKDGDVHKELKKKGIV